MSICGAYICVLNLTRKDLKTEEDRQDQTDYCASFLKVIPWEELV